MTAAIKAFQGEYRFLSNFWVVPGGVEFEGLVYPTVEHAYQAAKVTDKELRIMIKLAQTPGQAKRLGQRVRLINGWDLIKVEVMTELVRKKFQNGQMRRLLLKTEDAHLEEGNTWGDKFWGVCNGQGENNLGKILMAVRKELQCTLAS